MQSWLPISTLGYKYLCIYILLFKTFMCCVYAVNFGNIYINISTYLRFKTKQVVNIQSTL